jgi:hypothetical protein
MADGLSSDLSVTVKGEDKPICYLAFPFGHRNGKIGLFFFATGDPERTTPTPSHEELRSFICRSAAPQFQSLDDI